MPATELHAPDTAVTGAETDVSACPHEAGAPVSSHRQINSQYSPYAVTESIKCREVQRKRNYVCISLSWLSERELT